MSAFWVFVSLWYVGLPLLSLVDFYLAFPAWSIPEMLQFALSFFAFYAMAGNLILGVRIPIFQKIIPRDLAVRFHIISSIFLGLALVYHVLSKVLANKVLEYDSWLLLIIIPALGLLSTVWILSKLPYKIMRIIHNFGFAFLVGFSYWHVHLAGLETIGGIFSSSVYVFCTVFALFIWFLTIIHRTLAPQGTLVHTEILSSDIIRCTFRFDKPHRYKAGQFAYISFPELKGMEDPHPFSYLSAPKNPGGDYTIEFAMRMLGPFTKRLATLEANCKVKLEGSFGSFAPRNTRPSILLGTGIGTVPFISLLQYKSNSQTKPLQAILSVKNRSDLPLTKTEELQILESGHTLHFVEIIDEVWLKNTIMNPKSYDWLICSSPLIRQKLVKTLHALGVPRKQIRFESFSLGLG